MDAGELRPRRHHQGPDNETATVDLGAGLAGAVRTETLRAYDAEEMDRILAKLS